MKRRLLIIAVCLLLGAVVNVAVAWGSALAINPWRGLVGPRIGSRFGPDGTFSAFRFRRFTVTGYMLEKSQTMQEEYASGPDPHSLVPAWARFGEELDSARLSEHRYIDTRGWPMRSMWSEAPGAYLDHEGDSIEIPSEGGIETSLPSWRPFRTPRMLPLRPIWPGFALNTLLYAAIPWLLIPGPFAVRRFLRVRRGLCPKCAYPMGESAVCTECGIAMPRRRQGAAQRKRLSAARRGVHSSAHSEAIL